MGKFIDTIMKNGLYGKYEAEPEGVKLYADNIGVGIDKVRGIDTRYNIPKAPPKSSDEIVAETVVNTEIYRRAKLAVMQAEISSDSKHAILQAQRKQVAYGLDKYPEPLNANTWSISETVDHIMDESIDKLHYLIMLRIKLEQEIVSITHGDISNLYGKINRIQHMVDNAIDELDYLVALSEKEKGACNLTKGMSKDAMDAMAYAVKFSGADFDGDSVRAVDPLSTDELKKAMKYKATGKDTTGLPFQFEELW